MKTNGPARSVSERRDEQSEVLHLLPFLKNYGLSLCRKEDLADDLAQQTALKAIVNLNRFTPGSNMKAWLSTILRNEYFTHLRKRKREREWDDKYDNSVLMSTGLWTNKAENSVDYTRLLMLLACLPHEQMAAFIATCYLGMPYEEAAMRLSCAIGTVKSRVNRARQSLIGMMEDATLIHVELAQLKNATNLLAMDHPFYPIAKAYEELYAACDDVDTKPDGSGRVKATKREMLWRELVASGLLQDTEDNLPEFLEDYSNT